MTGGVLALNMVLGACGVPLVVVITCSILGLIHSKDKKLCIYSLTASCLAVATIILFYPTISSAL